MNSIWGLKKISILETIYNHNRTSTFKYLECLFERTWFLEMKIVTLKTHRNMEKKKRSVLLAFEVFIIEPKTFL